MNMSLNKLLEIVKYGSVACCSLWAVKSRTRLSHWARTTTELTPKSFVFINSLEYCSFFGGGNVSLWGFPSKETRMWADWGQGRSRALVVTSLPICGAGPEAGGWGLTKARTSLCFAFSTSRMETVEALTSQILIRIELTCSKHSGQCLVYSKQYGTCSLWPCFRLSLINTEGGPC